MGRLEALIVSALGRSPYDEKAVESKNPETKGVVDTTQQFDDRGHPVNQETRQRIRDHVRASNEVMQAAGIIEETSAVRDREISQQLTIRDETEVTVSRLARGRSLLSVGIWGVIGLRRRISLYPDYSNHSLLHILRTERAQYSISHILYAGLPVLVVCQVAEWVIRGGLVASKKKRTESLEQSKQGGYFETAKSTLTYSTNVVLKYVWVNCFAFSMLQQVNLFPNGRLFPSIWSFVPFSSHSPLELPPNPASFSPANMSSWLISLAVAITPMALVYSYGVIGGSVAALLYRPFYDCLPLPTNKPRPSPSSHVDDVHLNRSREATEETNVSGAPAGDMLAETADSNPVVLPSQSQDTGILPSVHSPTLSMLEEQAVGERLEIGEHDNDSGSEDGDHQMTSQTLITFDVEATDVTSGNISGTMGTWSAELRSANDVPTTPNGPRYRVTALTMLPPLLAADAFSMVLTGILMIPVEGLVVRVLARAYRRSAGLGTADMFGVGLRIPPLSLQRMTNLCGTAALQMVAVGLAWAFVVMGYTALSGGFDEEMPVEGEGEALPES